MATYTRSVALPSGTCVYTICKRRGHRSLTLTMHEDGRVRLTIPRWSSIREAEQYVRRKRKWLEAAWSHARHVVDTDKERARYLHYRERARMFVHLRLQALNTNYGFHYNRVSIRCNRTRWGSCSSAGNLSFDYRIVYLPPHVQDYLLVHELCHLKELNHGGRFWDLVARTVPDYTSCRAYLNNVARDAIADTATTGATALSQKER